VLYIYVWYNKLCPLNKRKGSAYNMITFKTSENKEEVSVIISNKNNKEIATTHFKEGEFTNSEMLDIAYDNSVESLLNGEMGIDFSCSK
jgi:hypothetical protein